MPQQSELSELRARIDDLEKETRFNTKVLAAGIRKTRLSLVTPQHDENIRRLRQPTATLDWHPRLGQAVDVKVADGLIDRLRNSGAAAAADNLGNTAVYIGSANVIWDALFENMPVFAVAPVVITAGPGFTLVGPYWQARYTVNSGAAPTQVRLGTLPRDDILQTSIVTSDLGQLLVNLGTLASNVTIDLEPQQDIGLGTILPYLVGAMRLLPLLSAGGATCSAQITLWNSGNLVATGDSFPLSLLGSTETQNIWASYSQPAVGTLGAIRPRFSFTVIKGVTGGAIAPQINFGDPAATASFSPDPPPFAPSIGRWIPGRAIRASNPFAAPGSSDYVARIKTLADTNYRVILGLDAFDNGQLIFGPGSGSPAQDARLRRAGGGVVRTDANGAAGIDAEHQVQAESGRRASVGIQINGDGNERAKLYGDATVAGLELGPGSAARDISLRRTANRELTLDDNNAAAASTILKLPSGEIDAFRAAAGNTVLLSSVIGDSSPFRFLVSADGNQQWGPGGATRDLRQSRAAAGRMQIDGNGQANETTLNLESTAGQRSLLNVRVNGDTVNRASFGGDATLNGAQWGPGNAAQDLRLYRSAAKVLTLDDTAGGGVTLNVINAIQQNGTAVSVAGHGAADHADITRKLVLVAEEATLDGTSTFVSVGASPNLSRVVNYPDAATSGAFWTFLVPSDWASGALTVQMIWTPAATDGTAHTVRWSMTVKRLTAGVDATAAGTTTAFTGASAARTLNLVVLDTATSSGVTPAAGDLVMIEVQRIGADAADTYVGAVRLHGLVVSYTANQ